MAARPFNLSKKSLLGSGRHIRTSSRAIILGVVVLSISVPGFGLSKRDEHIDSMESVLSDLNWRRRFLKFERSAAYFGSSLVKYSTLGMGHSGLSATKSFVLDSLKDLGPNLVSDDPGAPNSGLLENFLSHLQDPTGKYLETTEAIDQLTRDWLRDIISDKFYLLKIDKTLSAEEKGEIYAAFMAKLGKASEGWLSEKYDEEIVELTQVLMAEAARGIFWNPDNRNIGDLKRNLEQPPQSGTGKGRASEGRKSKPESPEKANGEIAQSEGRVTEYSVLEEVTRAKLTLSSMSEEEQLQLLKKAKGTEPSKSKAAESLPYIYETGRFFTSVGYLTDNKDLAHLGLALSTGAQLGEILNRGGEIAALASVNVVLAAALMIKQMEESAKQAQFMKGLFQEVLNIRQAIMDLREDVAYLGQELSRQIALSHESLSMQLAELSKQLGSVQASLLNIDQSIQDLRNEIETNQIKINEAFTALLNSDQQGTLRKCFKSDWTVIPNISEGVLSECIDNLVRFSKSHTSGTLHRINGLKDSLGNRPHASEYEEIVSYLRWLGRNDVFWAAGNESNSDRKLTVSRPDLWSFYVDRILDLLEHYYRFDDVWRKADLNLAIQVGQKTADFRKAIWQTPPDFFRKFKAAKNKTIIRKSPTEVVEEMAPYTPPKYSDYVKFATPNQMVEHLLYAVGIPYGGMADYVLEKNKKANKLAKDSVDTNWVWHDGLALPLAKNFFGDNKDEISKYEIESKNLVQCEAVPDLNLKQFGLGNNTFKIAKGKYVAALDTKIDIWRDMPVFGNDPNRHWVELARRQTLEAFARAVPSQASIEQSLMFNVKPGQLAIELPKHKGKGAREKLQVVNFNRFIPEQYLWLEKLSKTPPDGAETNGGKILVCYSDFHYSKWTKTYRPGTYKGRYKYNWINWTNNFTVSAKLNVFLVEQVGRKAGNMKAVYSPIRSYQVTQDFTLTDEKPLDGPEPSGYAFRGFLANLFKDNALPGIPNIKYSSVKDALTTAQKGSKGSWSIKEVPVNGKLVKQEFAQVPSRNRVLNDLLVLHREQASKSTFAGMIGSKSGASGETAIDLALDRIEQLVEITANDFIDIPNLEKRLKIDAAIKALRPKDLVGEFSKSGIKSTMAVVNSRIQNLADAIESYLATNPVEQNANDYFEIQLNALKRASEISLR